MFLDRITGIEVGRCREKYQPNPLLKLTVPGSTIMLLQTCCYCDCHSALLVRPGQTSTAQPTGRDESIVLHLTDLARFVQLLGLSATTLPNLSIFSHPRLLAMRPNQMRPLVAIQFLPVLWYQYGVTIVLRSELRTPVRDVLINTLLAYHSSNIQSLSRTRNHGLKVEEDIRCRS